MSAANPFEDPSVQESDFIVRLNKALGPIYADAFWEAEPGKFVSSDAVSGEFPTVTVTLTRGQFNALFYRAGG